ncbi:thioesterase II family protein [Streptomyces sp. NPDC085481]|uniref:thioesterase II family protein n=1 Tax=Streptomyces sp. NPDC085481 TaxID=3365727 RepID=UPI0037D26A1E
MPLYELTAPATPHEPAVGAGPLPYETTLVLLHHAGGSSRGFGPFLPHLPRSWRVLGVDLPGRLLDRGAARCRTAEEAVELVHREVWPELDGPCAVFGHSMGALLAFELVRRLEAEGRAPDWLGVSGSLAPHARRAATATVLRHALAPTPGQPEALARLVARTVRDDLTLVDGYEYAAGPPLRTPLAVFGGTDDPLAPASRLGAWSAHSPHPVAYHLWPGGHFYLFDHAEAVCGAVRAHMAKAPAPRG